MSDDVDIEIDAEVFARLEAYANEHGTTPRAIVERLAGGGAACLMAFA